MREREKVGMESHANAAMILIQSNLLIEPTAFNFRRTHRSLDQVHLLDSALERALQLDDAACNAA